MYKQIKFWHESSRTKQFTHTLTHTHSRLLHGIAPGNTHNENKRLKSKIAPPMAPKDNGARNDSALCNAGLPILNTPNLELGYSKQGKYEEEKKKNKQNGGTLVDGIL